jgi:hypothetical protein
MNLGYFVLFHSEGMVKTTTIPSSPPSFTFRGSTYQRCRRFLTEFNHLVRGRVLVGFQFLSPKDAGDDFLASRFVTSSRNVSLEYWGGTSPVLEIYLGSREKAESDQAAVLGGWLFAGGEQDYILVLPRMTWADFEFGFQLASDDSPSPNDREGDENVV